MQTQHASQPGSMAAPSGSGRVAHIPGPWFYDEATETIYAEDGARDPWTIIKKPVDPLAGPEAKETRQANMRLMAAAPDLLDAAEDAMSLLDEAIRSGDVSQLRANQAWSKCKAAISAATGQNAR